MTPTHLSYIRALYRLGTYTQAQIAYHFDTHQPTVGGIVSGLKETEPTTDLEREAAELRAKVDELGKRIIASRPKTEKEELADFVKNVQAHLAKQRGK